MSSDWKRLSWIGAAMALASIGPLIFPAAQAGHASMALLTTRLLLPAVAALFLMTLSVRRTLPGVTRAILWGALAGAVATLALEAVRLPGYRLGFMPGNLPRLMGVLILDRFALGPSPASDLAGWAYHFWNGASFGILYALVFGTQRRWVGVPFGLSLGLGFMVSPVVLSLGVGYFGLQFSLGFPATVLLAHLAFGLALGFLARRLVGSASSPLLVSAARLVRASSVAGDPTRAV